MSKFSTMRRRLLSILPGLIVGVTIGTLLTALHYRHPVASVKSGFKESLLDVDRLSPAELETLTLTALSTLRKKNGSISTRGVYGADQANSQSTDIQRSIRTGIDNARRLLPLAKQLTLESLSKLKSGDAVISNKIAKEKRLIDGANSIVLDPNLGDMAEVRENRLWEIRIGADYARYLVSDDETIFLLGHELMHVAVRAGGLKQIIENMNRKAQRAVSFEASSEQQEDLACEFIGAQALKRFIELNPTSESEETRLSRVFGYLTASEKLAFIWEDVCAADYEDASAQNHLGRNATIHALVELDPSLKVRLSVNSIGSFCQ